MQPAAKATGFAAALQNAAAKPARKPAPSKVPDHGSSGGHPPVPGNASPPPALPVAVAAPALSGTLVGSAANGTLASGTAPLAAAAPVMAGAPSSPLKSADPSPVVAHAAPSAAPAGAADAAPAAGLDKVVGIPVTSPSNDNRTASANTPAATAAVEAAAPPASEIQVSAAAQAGVPNKTLQTEKRSGAAAPVPTAPPAAATTAATRAAAKPATGAATTPATGAATTAAADGSSAVNTAVSTNASTSAAQMTTAAAISAGEAGFAAVAAGVADASSPTDRDATTPAGGVAPDAVGPAGAAAPAPAATASTLAAVASAQAASALANIGAAEKHSRNATGDSSAPGITAGGTAGAAQFGANPTTVTDAAATPTLRVAAGVETPEFGQGVANHVSWMVDNNLNGAKLQVNPPQLGPIEVRIAVQGDHAQVWLMSHSAVTRDALEASSPKLREMLGAQGFGQVSVDISQRSFQERPTPQPYEWTPSANRGPATAAVQSSASSIPRIASGAVDAYV